MIDIFRQNAVETGVSEEPRTALLARRRRSLLTKCLLGSLLTAAGMSIVVDDEPKLMGAFIAVVFGVCTIWWAALLLLPQEDLLEFPESSFEWIAPSDSEIHAGSLGVVEKANTLPARPESLGTHSGVWDRELDGGW